MTRFKLMTVTSMAATCLLLLLMLLTQGPAVEAQNTGCYRAQGGALWVCASGGEMEFRSGATLDVQSGATFTADDLTVADDLSAADLINPPPAVAVVSDGSTITPLGAFQPISSTGATGTATIAGCTAGRVTTLANQANTTITITDTGNLRLAGNAALGQYDTLTVRCLNGTLWLEVARANN